MRMKILHASLFLLLGTGLLVGPAFWPECFGVERERSALWLETMGGLQLLGGATMTGLELYRLLRRWTETELLEFSLQLPDLRWVAPPSLYVRPEEADEAVRALRLQRQLRQPFAA
jgi:hypothetical protein